MQENGVEARGSLVPLPHCVGHAGFHKFHTANSSRMQWFYFMYLLSAENKDSFEAINQVLVEFEVLFSFAINVRKF